MPAYLGAWPRPGYLDQLPFGLSGGPPDIMGFSRSFIGLWRWQMGGFSVLSFDRSILENCATYVRQSPADDFAQGRLTVRNLSASKLSSWFNTYSFRRSAQTTRGNLMLLDSMEQQLNVPRAQARQAAEELLDAKLQCALGGELELSEGGWGSSAWPEKLQVAPNAHVSDVGYDTMHTVPPATYRAPWLDWFRGAQLHLTQLPERLIVVGQLDLEKLPPRKTSSDEATESDTLPKMNFDIYNLPFQFFNGDKPSADKSKNPKPKESKDKKSTSEPKRKF
jgi:hypothetical protein